MYSFDKTSHLSSNVLGKMITFEFERVKVSQISRYSAFLPVWFFQCREVNIQYMVMCSDSEEFGRKLPIEKNRRFKTNRQYLVLKTYPLFSRLNESPSVSRNVNGLFLNAIAAIAAIATIDPN